MTGGRRRRVRKKGKGAPSWGGASDQDKKPKGRFFFQEIKKATKRRAEREGCGVLLRGVRGLSVLSIGQNRRGKAYGNPS